MSREEKKTLEKFVTNMLAFTHGTLLEADAYEQRMLDHYVQGRLTLTQVEYLLEKRQAFVQPARL